jgi:hypothetical protein
MTTTEELLCEACGQLASPEHIARRLRRLEWTTRYRPLHIQSLLLSAIAPVDDADFLYAPDGQFHGEAGALLDALELSREGKSADTILTEVQKRGILFTHVLECPLEPSQKDSSLQQLLERRIPSNLARIRRSLKPKRLLLLSPELAGVQSRFTVAELSIPIFFDQNHRPFQLPIATASRESFLRALASSAAA